jgi:alpha-glucoside transport system substrate-binding protein
LPDESREEKIMFKQKNPFVVIGLLAVATVLLAACQPETIEVVKTVEVEVPGEEVIVEVPAETNIVTVLGTWGGAERDAFTDVALGYTDQTGVGVAFEGTRDLSAVLTTRVEAGNPPDIAIVPNPAEMQKFAAQGALVDISAFMDMDQLATDYAQVWLDLGSSDGTLYGIFYKAANKSLVWYSPGAFEAGGYEVPTNWDEMIALSDQIVADGGTPWCVGFESAAASGWPATDWVEDIMLRTAGPDVYDQWVSHEIAWTDPAVKTAWEYFGQIAANEDYVLGGTTGVVSTNFGDSPADLFTDPPGCYMHRQASFITGFFPEGLEAGVDYDFFPFPEIDSQWGVPALGAADMVIMFNDTENARALMQYLATAEAQEIWAAKGDGSLWPNKSVSLDVYEDPIQRSIAEALVNAEVFRFDASDLMPTEVGSGTFWSGTLDYVTGTDLDTVLADIEASVP